MRREQTQSYPVSIFVAGDYTKAREICRAFCDEEGLCVTVTATTYIYTGGEEAGVIVGLINYPRFPSEPSGILTTAKLLALELMSKLEQESVSVQTPDETHWFSIRNADLAIADTHPKGGDAKQAPSLMSGGGAGTAIAQPQTPIAGTS
jgi:hypothetical protein